MKFAQRVLIPLTCLVGCAGVRSVAGNSEDYLPFEIGRSWVYEIAESGGSPLRLYAGVEGSDLRSLADQVGIVFPFVYGRPEGEQHVVTKSIYALCKGGPCEFHFDVSVWSLSHEPPIPLLPDTPRVGSETVWSGLVQFEDVAQYTRGRVRVEGQELIEVDGEAIETLRVRTSYEALALDVTRWFARGVGLVRLQAERGKGAIEVQLVALPAPP